MAAISLEKFDIIPEDDNAHVFTFIFSNPQKLLDIKSIESSEVTYGGHRWSLVCMKKDERFMGVFLKWRYSDGQTAPSMAAKTKYSICLIHRHDYTCNKYFNSSQKFTSTQTMLGKSKFIPLSDMLDPATGYLDGTGTRLVFELSMSRISTRFERLLDISPKARTKKNASGYYYDTPLFHLAAHKWYLRVYPCKINSNGLPAVYLYLSSRPRGINLDIIFRLYIGQDTTETLTYNFGEGAKFDGFGKTLPRPIYNIERQTELIIGVEVDSIIISKDVLVSVKSAFNNIYNQQSLHTSPAFRHLSGTGRSLTGFGVSPQVNGFGASSNAAFQDIEGNQWVVEMSQNAQGRLTLLFNKAHHQYPQNRTKVLCWAGTLLSRDPNSARDIEMNGDPNVGYFSNFIDEKGYLMTFPVEKSELETKESLYSTDAGELVVRITMLSLQTVPTIMKGIPKLEYQSRHLQKARKIIQEKQRGLDEMREMSASRASLSQLDLSQDINNSSRLASDSGSDAGGKPGRYKSLESLENPLTNGDLLHHQNLLEDDTSKGFFSDFLHHMAVTFTITSDNTSQKKFYVTSRDAFHGARGEAPPHRELNGSTKIMDENSLFIEARPSPRDMGQHKEVTDGLIMFLQQKLPFRVSEVLEFGSVGSGTVARSRADVDLVVFSPDLPRENQEKWYAGLLHAVSRHIQNHSATPDPLFPIAKCDYFGVTPSALQFTCGGLDVDIMLSYDWSNEEAAGYDALYNLSCKQCTAEGRYWYSLAASRLQKKFVTEQPNETKELIRVAKHWRNNVQWKKSSHRPNSYLLSLLIIKAAEETKSFDMKAVFSRVGHYINSPELSVSWSTFYVPDKYPVDFDPPAPLIRDPANPGYNVAESLPYWGEFRSEFTYWLPTIDCAATLL